MKYQIYLYLQLLLNYEMYCHIFIIFKIISSVWLHKIINKILADATDFVARKK